MANRNVEKEQPYRITPEQIELGRKAAKIGNKQPGFMSNLLGLKENPMEPPKAPPLSETSEKARNEINSVLTNTVKFARNLDNEWEYTLDPKEIDASDKQLDMMWQNKVKDLEANGYYAQGIREGTTETALYETKNFFTGLAEFFTDPNTALARLNLGTKEETPELKSIREWVTQWMSAKEDVKAMRLKYKMEQYTRSLNGKPWSAGTFGREGRAMNTLTQGDNAGNPFVDTETNLADYAVQNPKAVDAGNEPVKVKYDYNESDVAGLYINKAIKGGLTGIVEGALRKSLNTDTDAFTIKDNLSRFIEASQEGTDPDRAKEIASYIQSRAEDGGSIQDTAIRTIGDLIEMTSSMYSPVGGFALGTKAFNYAINAARASKFARILRAVDAGKLTKMNPEFRKRFEIFNKILNPKVAAVNGSYVLPKVADIIGSKSEYIGRLVASSFVDQMLTADHKLTPEEVTENLRNMTILGGFNYAFSKAFMKGAQSLLLSKTLAGTKITGLAQKQLDATAKAMVGIGQLVAQPFQSVALNTLDGRDLTPEQFVADIIMGLGMSYGDFFKTAHAKSEVRELKSYDRILKENYEEMGFIPNEPIREQLKKQGKQPDSDVIDQKVTEIQEKNPTKVVRTIKGTKDGQEGTVIIAKQTYGDELVNEAKRRLGIAPETELTAGDLIEAYSDDLKKSSVKNPVIKLIGKIAPTVKVEISKDLDSPAVYDPETNTLKVDGKNAYTLKKGGIGKAATVTITHELVHGIVDNKFKTDDAFSEKMFDIYYKLKEKADKWLEGNQDIFDAMSDTQKEMILKVFGNTFDVYDKEGNKTTKIDDVTNAHELLAVMYEGSSGSRMVRKFLHMIDPTAKNTILNTISSALGVDSGLFKEMDNLLLNSEHTFEEDRSEAYKYSEAIKPEEPEATALPGELDLYDEEGNIYSEQGNAESPFEMSHLSITEAMDYMAQEENFKKAIEIKKAVMIEPEEKHPSEKRNRDFEVEVKVNSLKRKLGVESNEKLDKLISASDDEVKAHIARYVQDETEQKNTFRKIRNLRKTESIGINVINTRKGSRLTGVEVINGLTPKKRPVKGYTGKQVYLAKGLGLISTKAAESGLFDELGLQALNELANPDNMVLIEGYYPEKMITNDNGVTFVKIADKAKTSDKLEPSLYATSDIGGQMLRKGYFLMPKVSGQRAVRIPALNNILNKKEAFVEAVDKFHIKRMLENQAVWNYNYEKAGEVKRLLDDVDAGKFIGAVIDKIVSELKGEQKDFYLKDTLKDTDSKERKKELTSQQPIYKSLFDEVKQLIKRYYTDPRGEIIMPDWTDRTFNEKGVLVKSAKITDEAVYDRLTSIIYRLTDNGYKTSFNKVEADKIEAIKSTGKYMNIVFADHYNKLNDMNEFADMAGDVRDENGNYDKDILKNKYSTDIDNEGNGNVRTFSVSSDYLTDKLGFTDEEVAEYNRFIKMFSEKETDGVLLSVNDNLYSLIAKTLGITDSIDPVTGETRETSKRIAGIKPKGLEFSGDNIRITKGMLWNINNMKEIAKRNPWLGKIIQTAKDNNIGIILMPTASKGRHTANVKFVAIDEKTRAVVDNDNVLIKVETKSGENWVSKPEQTETYKSEFGFNLMKGILPAWSIGHMKITGDDALTFENYVHGADINKGANGFESILPFQRTSELFAGAEGQEVYNILDNHITYNIGKGESNIQNIITASEIGARMMQGVGRLKPDLRVTSNEHKALGSFIEQALDYLEGQIDSGNIEDTVYSYGENAYVLFDRLSQMVDSRGNFILSKLPLLISMDNILAGRTLTEGNMTLAANIMQNTVQDMTKGRVPVMTSKMMPDFNAEAALVYTINKIAQIRLDDAMKRSIDIDTPTTAYINRDAGVYWTPAKMQQYRDLVKMEIASEYGIDNYDEYEEATLREDYKTGEFEATGWTKKLTPSETFNLLGSKYIDENGKITNRGVIIGRDNYEKEIRYRRKMHQKYPDRGFDKPLMPGDEMLFVKIPSDDFTNTLMPLYFAGIADIDGVVITEGNIVHYTGGDFDGDSIAKFLADENFTPEAYKKVFDYILSKQSEIQQSKDLANQLKEMAYTRVGNERAINRYLGVPYKNDNNAPQFPGLGRRLASHQTGQDLGITIINNISRAIQQINNDVANGKPSDVILKDELKQMMKDSDLEKIPGWSALHNIKINTHIDGTKSAIMSDLKQTFVDSHEQVPFDRLQGVIAGMTNDFELVYDTDSPKYQELAVDGFPERLKLYHLGGDFNPGLERPENYDKLTLAHPNTQGQETKLLLGNAIIKHMFDMAGIEYKNLMDIENPHDMIDRVISSNKVDNPGNTYTKTLEAIRRTITDNSYTRPELPEMQTPLETDVFMERTTPQKEVQEIQEVIPEVEKPEQVMPTENETESTAKVGEEPVYIPMAGKMLQSIGGLKGADIGIIQGLKARYANASKLIWGTNMQGEAYDQIRNSDLTNSGMYHSKDVVGIYPDFTVEPDWVEIDKAIASNVQGFIIKTENRKKNSTETIPIFSAIKIADYVTENGYERWTNRKGEQTDYYVKKGGLKTSAETLATEVTPTMAEPVKTQPESNVKAKELTPIERLKQITVKDTSAIGKATENMQKPIDIINAGSGIKAAVGEGIYEKDSRLMAQIKAQYPDALVVMKDMDTKELNEFRGKTIVVMNKPENKGIVTYLAKEKYDYVVAGYEDMGFALPGEAFAASNGLEIASTIYRSEIAENIQKMVLNDTRTIINRQITGGTLAKYSFDDFFEPKIAMKKGYSQRGPIEYTQYLLANIMYGGKPEASENSLTPFEFKTEDGKIKNKDFLRTLTEWKDLNDRPLFGQPKYMPFKIASGTVLKYLIDNNTSKLGDYVLRSNNDIPTLTYKDGVIADSFGHETKLEDVFNENGELVADWLPPDFLQSPEFRDLITMTKPIDARELDNIKAKVITNMTESTHKLFNELGIDIDKGLLYTAFAFYEVQRDKKWRETNSFKGSIANMRGTNTGYLKSRLAQETGHWLTKTHLGGKMNDNIALDYGMKFVSQHSNTDLWKMIRTAHEAGIVPKVSNDVTLEDYIMHELDKKGKNIGLAMSASSIEEVSWKDKSVKDFFETIRKHAAKSNNQLLIDAVQKPMSEWSNETMMAINDEVIKPYLQKILPPLALGTGKGSIEEAKEWSDHTIDVLMRSFLSNDRGYMNLLENAYDRIAGANTHSRQIARNFMNQNYLASVAEMIMQLRKTKSGSWLSNVKIWGSKLPTEMLKKHSMNKVVFSAMDEILTIPEVVNGSTKIQAGDVIRFKDEADWELGVQLPYMLLPKQYPMIMAAVRMTKLLNSVSAEANNIRSTFETLERDNQDIAKDIEDVGNINVGKISPEKDEYGMPITEPGKLMDEIGFQTKTKNGIIQEGKVILTLQGKNGEPPVKLITDVSNKEDLKSSVDQFLESWVQHIDPKNRDRVLNYIKYRTALENYKNMLITYSKTVESFANKYKGGGVIKQSIDVKDNLYKVNSYIEKMGKLTPNEVAMMIRDVRDDVNMSDVVQYFQDNLVTPSEEAFMKDRNMQLKFNTDLRAKYKDYTRVKAGAGQADMMGKIRGELKKLLSGDTKISATANESFVSPQERNEIDRQIKAGNGSAYVLSKYGAQIDEIISRNIIGTQLIIGKDENGKVISRKLSKSEQLELFNSVLSDVRNVIDVYFNSDNTYYNLFHKLGIKGYEEPWHMVSNQKEWENSIKARKEIIGTVRKQMQKLAKDAQVNYYNQFIVDKDAEADIKVSYNFSELFQKAFADKMDGETRVVDKFFTTRLEKAYDDVNWVMTNSLIDVNNNMLHNYLENDRDGSSIADMNTISVLTNTIGMPFNYGEELPVNQYNTAFKATDLTAKGSYFIPDGLHEGEIITMKLKNGKTMTARLLGGVKCKEKVINKQTHKAEVVDTPYYVFSNDLNNSPNQSFVSADMIQTMRIGKSSDWTMRKVDDRMKHYIKKDMPDMADKFKTYITQFTNDKGAVENDSQNRAENSTINYIRSFKNDKSVAQFIKWGTDMADRGQVALYYMRARHLLTGLAGFGVGLAVNPGVASYYLLKGSAQYLTGMVKLYMQNGVGFGDNLALHPVARRKQQGFAANFMRGLGGIKQVWTFSNKPGSENIASIAMPEITALESASQGHLHEQLQGLVTKIVESNEAGSKYFKNKFFKTAKVNKLGKGLADITQEMTENTELAERMRDGEERTSRAIRKVADKIEWNKLTIKKGEYEKGEYVLKDKTVYVPKVKGLSDHDSFAVLTMWDQLMYFASLKGGILNSEKSSAQRAVRTFYDEKVGAFTEEYGGHISSAFTANILEREAAMGYGNYKRNMDQKTWFMRNLNRFAPFGYEKGQNITKYNMTRQDMYKAYRKSNGPEFDRFIGDMKQLGIPIGEWFLEKSNALPKAFAIRGTQMAIKYLTRFGLYSLLAGAGKTINMIFNDPSQDVDDILSLQGFAFGPLEMMMQTLAAGVNMLLISGDLDNLSDAKKTALANELLKQPGQAIRGVLGKGATDAMNALVSGLYLGWKAMSGEEIAGLYDKKDKIEKSNLKTEIDLLNWIAPGVGTAGSEYINQTWEK